MNYPARRASAPPPSPTSKRHGSGIEKRAHPRAPLDVEVTLESDSNFFAGLTRDISRGGIFVATYRAMSIGTHVNVELSLPDGPLRITGTVRWTREHSDEAARGVGIGFDTLSAADRERVEKFCDMRAPYYYEVDE